MKYNAALFLLLSTVLWTGCVQKTKLNKVKYLVNVYGLKNIEKVGVRGSDNPLSWDADLDLKPIVKDSMYAVEVIYNTGYNVTEVKFTVNGIFELQNQDNRIIRFSESGRTEARFVFDRP
ncbi:hypothetical protein FLLO111716_12460 [Flavobacterium longum]|uniref:hypothetical protein n=1 Tax=Flavobacterium longum TaxID=1299340 RepID=UPI0039E8A5E6